MSEASYSVVTLGDIQPGLNRDEVGSSIRSLCKYNAETVQRVFSGKPFVFKAGLDLATAKKYKTALDKTGIVCRVAQPKQKPANMPPAGARPALQKISCPSCNVEQEEGLTCVSCGIDFRKHQRQQEQTAASPVGNVRQNSQVPVRPVAEGNFLFAVIAGGIAAIISAGIWAGVTIATGYQIGWMAIGVGFIVAMAVRMTGNGITLKFQMLGASLSFLGCLLGNYLAICYFIAQNERLGYLQLLSLMKFSEIPGIMISTFSAMDILFYGLAVYQGFKLSLSQASEE